MVDYALFYGVCQVAKRTAQPGQLDDDAPGVVVGLYRLSAMETDVTLQEELIAKIGEFNRKIAPGAKVFVVFRHPELFLVLTDGVYYTYYRNDVYNMAEIMSTNDANIDDILTELHRIWHEFIKEMEQ